MILKELREVLGRLLFPPWRPHAVVDMHLEMDTNKSKPYFFLRMTR
jgi:hypothetical protein